MDLLMEKLAKLNNDIVDNQQESGTGLTLLLVSGTVLVYNMQQYITNVHVQSVLSA